LGELASAAILPETSPALIALVTPCPGTIARCVLRGGTIEAIKLSARLAASRVVTLSADAGHRKLEYLAVLAHMFDYVKKAPGYAVICSTQISGETGEKNGRLLHGVIQKIGKS